MSPQQTVLRPAPRTLRRPVEGGDIRVVSGVEARPSITHYERLEAQSWAPWLRFSRPVLAEQVRAFPDEQFFAFDQDGLVGALSTNRISWDGDVASLSTWDAIAGDRQDYHGTHVADGNTLCLMSMSIARRARSSGIARELLLAARASVQDRGMDHLVGDFRPSGYGSFKMRGDDDFLSYIELRDRDGRLIDPWLRAVTRLGMRRLRVDEQAMVVEVSCDEFERLRRQSPSVWVRTAVARDAALHQSALPFPLAGCEFWEAEQTGTWYVSREAARAVYIESGVWGTVQLDGAEDRDE